jgi:Gluconate 2-dehydrogenase subunit 3
VGPLLLSDAGVTQRHTARDAYLMPLWLTDDEMAVLEAVADCLIPADELGPGAVAAGAVDYIDRILGAFLVDPPLIWAGGPTSGRHGGEAAYGSFHRLSAIDELSWRTRIEGSAGIPEREFNGPVVGLQQMFREGLAGLGTDFLECQPTEQVSRLRSKENKRFARLVFGHLCEGLYGAPEYGGNRDNGGWRSIDFAGDVQPRGWTDAEVAEA